MNLRPSGIILLIYFIYAATIAQLLPVRRSVANVILALNMLVLGGYIAPMWGWRHFRVGPRLQAGVYWSSPVPTFGIFVTPLTARLLF